MSAKPAFKPIIKRPGKKFFYKRLFEWRRKYRRFGTDKAAIDKMMEEESAEFIRIFRTELMTVKKGIYDEKTFDKVIGQDRKKRFKSYEGWATHMIKLIASYKG
jgi:hypothetical protein